MSTLPLRIFLKASTLSFKKDTITAKSVPYLKWLEGRKKLRFTLKRKHLVFISFNLRQLFENNVGNDFGVMMRGNGPHELEIAYDIVSIHAFMIYKDLIDYKKLVTQNFIYCVAFPLFQS